MGTNKKSSTLVSFIRTFRSIAAAKAWLTEHTESAIEQHEDKLAFKWLGWLMTFETPGGYGQMLIWDKQIFVKMRMGVKDEREEDWKSAGKHYWWCLDLQPAFHPAHYRYARMCLKLNQPKCALAHLEMCVKMKPQCEIYQYFLNEAKQQIPKQRDLEYRRQLNEFERGGEKGE